MSGDPVLEARGESDFLADLGTRLGGALPGWRPRDGEPAQALARIQARYLSILAGVVNQVPAKLRLAFLDQLGFTQPVGPAARAVLVFTLNPSSLNAGSSPDTLIAGSPRAPELVVPMGTRAGAQAAGDRPIVFETEEDVSLTAAQLTTIVTVSPARDAYELLMWDPSAPPAVSLFAAPRQIEHALYLGDRRLALSGEATIALSVETVGAGGGGEGARLAWELWDGNRWRSLGEPTLDTTRGLSRTGEVKLTTRGLVAQAAGAASLLAADFAAATDPDPTSITHTSEATDPKDAASVRTYWLRGRLIDRLVGGTPEGRVRLGAITVASEIEAAGDPQSIRALVNGRPADATSALYPFGMRPRLGMTFALLLDPRYAAPGAVATVSWHVAAAATAGGSTRSAPPALVWEYWAGTGWDGLVAGAASSSAEAAMFLAAGSLTFTIPSDLKPVNLGGTDGAWIRVRLAGGNYAVSREVAAGATPFLGRGATVTVDEVRPPVLDQLQLTYRWITEPAPPAQCLAVDNGLEKNLTAELARSEPAIPLFVPCAEDDPTVYFGFDQQLPDGRICLHVDRMADAPDSTHAATWALWDGTAWQRVHPRDETAGLARAGIVAVSGAAVAVPLALFGVTPRRWLRVRLAASDLEGPIQLNGIRGNCVWARERRSVVAEVLGNGTGAARQSFRLANHPALDGEVIEVREVSSGTPYSAVQADLLIAELKQRGFAESEWRTTNDPVTGEPVEVWVRWENRPTLALSGPRDRHYVIDRVNGLVTFGGGGLGKPVPPGAANVTASYASGGGAAGNVAPGAINALLAAVPNVTGVTNPLPAAGGADAPRLDDYAGLASAVIGARFQATTARDYESLARSASPAVATARSLPATDPAGHPRPGWVSVAIVPHSPDAQPVPSCELIRQVRDYIAPRMPTPTMGRLDVRGPRYAPVGVIATVGSSVITASGTVLVAVQEALARFLHPVLGGNDGSGWPFGSSVSAADIAATMHRVTGVDHVSMLTLTLTNGERTEQVTTAEDELIACGALAITVNRTLPS